MPPKKTFPKFFSEATGQTPHSWQTELAIGPDGCKNQLIRIPTGFGKTFGVLLAWLWNAIEQKDHRWPRRLVICLPMRVLVEQTEKEVRHVLEQLGRLWSSDGGEHKGRVGLHVLMGGMDAGEWYLWPEQFAVLICTQDMGLSAALNRSYSAPRARWPAEFGLINQDALWVMDEVQLMDVGLATSTQLQAFRDDDLETGHSMRPSFTWWMSATLQPDWLTKSPDSARLSRDLAGSEIRIPASERRGHLWDDVFKPMRLERIRDEKALAEFAFTLHLQHGSGLTGPTLLVVNTVERAIGVFQALQKRRNEMPETDLKLVHSRFRSAEREQWREGFLNKKACSPGTNRIIVATQVIEAGVDISSTLLITELAPWPSLVQRFGRCARWGGTARVVVADFDSDERKAAPYTLPQLIAARIALSHLQDVAPRHLEIFEEQHPDQLAALYPYQPKHLLLRHELDELFDTTPDLSGADIDISRFIRSGEERDVQLFWRELDSRPEAHAQPTRNELCSAPFLRVREWLFGNSKIESKTFASGKQAWVWNWINGQWVLATARDIHPGKVLLIPARCGGYGTLCGFDPLSKAAVPVISSAVTVLAAEAQHADASENNEELSIQSWQTIAVHGREVGKLVRELAETLAPSLMSLLGLAGRWHDAGKAHPAFRGCIDTTNSPYEQRADLAKAPHHHWRKRSKLYTIFETGKRDEQRLGFRHELASTLMLFDVLRRHQPEHPALLGPWQVLLEQAGIPVSVGTPNTAPPTPIELEVLKLDDWQFDLLAYLVCTHHGKVRLAWHSGKADHESNSTKPRICGVQQDDKVPMLLLAAEDGSTHQLPESLLDLALAAAGLNPVTGRGWTERVLNLLNRFGPFTLAWLEALMIASDRRASRLSHMQDELLQTGRHS